MAACEDRLLVWQEKALDIEPASARSGHLTPFTDQRQTSRERNTDFTSEGNAAHDRDGCCGQFIRV